MEIETFLNKNNILYSSLYPYGSQLYGTADKHSDYDFIVISQNERGTIKIDDMEISFYSPVEWASMIHDHNIIVLECESHFRNKSISWIDKSILRHSISSKCSNSYVKAKKKMTVENDYDLRCAKKSLFHSLRIYVFGIQIAKKGYIYDFKAANNYYNDIMAIDSNNWDCYHTMFKPHFNSLASEFRKLAPKEKNVTRRYD